MKYFIAIFILLPFYITPLFDFFLLIFSILNRNPRVIPAVRLYKLYVLVKNVVNFEVYGSQKVLMKIDP